MLSLARNFQQMTEQAKAGDVSQCMHAWQGGQQLAGLVQLGRIFDQAEAGEAISLVRRIVHEIGKTQEPPISLHEDAPRSYSRRVPIARKI